MANGTIVTNNGLKIMLNRTYKSTPDYKAPTRFKIGTGTTTPDVSDTDLETPVDIETGVQIKVFVSGYPIINETTLQATIRAYINSLEANGNSITEFGLFNQDVSPLIFSHAVFTAVTKDDSVEISFLQKDIIE